MPSYAIQLAQDLVRCPSVTPADERRRRTTSVRWQPRRRSPGTPALAAMVALIAAGSGDGRRGAVIIDTVGADGCVTVISVTAQRVGPMAGGDCADGLVEYMREYIDPLAAVFKELSLIHI